MCIAKAYIPYEMLNHAARIQSKEIVQSTFYECWNLIAFPLVVLNLVTILKVACFFELSLLAFNGLISSCCTVYW